MSVKTALGMMDDTPDSGLLGKAIALTSSAEKEVSEAESIAKMSEGLAEQIRFGSQSIAEHSVNIHDHARSCQAIAQSSADARKKAETECSMVQELASKGAADHTTIITILGEAEGLIRSGLNSMY